MLGGTALSCLDSTIVSEEIAYGCTGVLTAITTSGLAAAPLMLGGSEEQKKHYFGRLIAEPIIAVCT